MVKKIFNKLLARRVGVVDGENCPFFSPQMMKDLSGEDKEILKTVKPFTMTSPERVVALIQSVRYLTNKDIPGSLVECGVWKGGSMLAAALTLMEINAADRKLYLFDTYTGMTEPSVKDVDVKGGYASEQYKQQENWCAAGLNEVKANMQTSLYPEALIHYIVGDVMENLPDNAPKKIALLRLDTDWYESTKYELETLFPRLSKGGVLIIDDYGHWQGAKKAVHEYFFDNKNQIELYKIDYTGRVAIKKG